MGVLTCVGGLDSLYVGPWPWVADLHPEVTAS